MRPRNPSVPGCESEDFSKHAAASLRWSSREGTGWRRGAGRKDLASLNSFSRKTIRHLLALRVTLLVVVAALLFVATHSLCTRRRQDRFPLAHESTSSSITPKHGHRARAAARRVFVSVDPASSVSTITGSDKEAAAAPALPLQISLGASFQSASAAAASGGELVQRRKPATLIVVVPFTLKDAGKVVDGLDKWSRPGDPCAIARHLQRDSRSSSGRGIESGGEGSSGSGNSTSTNTNSGSSASPVDLLFWFNRDLEDAKDETTNIKQRFLRALTPSSHCFGRVDFKSAYLSEDEDSYPLGPSNQWYSLFLSLQRPLAGYDYAFWCEHDVAPVQPGWIDALLLEVTFRGDFFVKGSIHRGRKLDNIVLFPDDASWVTHINGNALYKANDRDFTAMVAQCEERNRGSKSFLSSFDAAMWIQHVTRFASKWTDYQNYAHKFQYTDLIQNLNEDVPWPDGAHKLVASSPGTFLVHGTSASAGEAHRQKTFVNGVALEPPSTAQPSPSLSLPVGDELATSEQSPPYRPKTFQPERIAVVVPLIASQIEKLRVLFSLSSQDAFRACDPEDSREAPIDLVFQISSTWFDESRTKGNEAYMSLSSLLGDFPLFTSCFGGIHVLEASLKPSEDVHTAYVFTGPNLQFRRMMNDNWLRDRYSHLLLLEPDATPIKHDWLERFWLEARGVGMEESFWIKGTAYRGFRGDWVRNPNPYNITTVSSMWAAMNGNGIYNLQDPEFYEFMDRVWEAHPALPFDAAIHAYLFDVENFDYTKRALTKIRYSSFVQNHGATRFDIPTIRRESPETYIVHSSCREEFPDKKAYCFVCDKDEPWSGKCQIKLKSDDVSLDYDRFSTGPTFTGPELSNANAQELWRLNVVV